MKVVCDACQAKYQIPDERVAGRKLKIRCRKCGDTIVIRGDQEAADRATAESLPPSSIEWHVSLQGDQHGPYPPEQMAEMLRGGQLSWDAYVWRESYGDWRMAGDSDTLVRAVANSVEGATTTDETPTRTVQPSSLELSKALRPSASPTPVVGSVSVASRGSQPPHVSSPSNGSSRSNGGALGSRPPHAFAATAAVGSASLGLQPSEHAGPRVSAEAVLTGERHEDSVLFSTRNLTATPTVTPPRAGYAGGEGSGLIDIRALAALARSNQGVTRPSVEESRPLSGPRGSDEVARLANQTGAFGNLESLSPIDYPPRQTSNALPVAILGGSAMIAVAGVIAVYLWRPQPAPQSVAVTAPTEQAATQVAEPMAAHATSETALAAAAKPRAPEPSDTAEPDALPARPSITAPQPVNKFEASKTRAAIPALTAKAAPAKRAIAAEPAHAAKTGTAQPKSESALDDLSEPKTAKKESPSIDDLLLDKKPEPTKAGKSDEPSVASAAPAKSKEPARSRSIDDLLDEAVPSKEAAAAKKNAAAEAASEALPESPTRDQVLAAMRSIDGDVQACTKGQELEASTANVLLTVSGSSGRVSSARVTGVVGAVGSCVANAVRNATFPKFAKAQFTLNFPFKLRK